LLKINSPKELKKLPQNQLPQLAEEIRRAIIDVVSKNGGHLASNLGVVELTIALHYCFDTPFDKLVWDVGHQCYAHKILTGRREKFQTLRQMNGLSGFPNPKESQYDLVNSGHGSTSISFCLGLAQARDYESGKEKIVAVIGDGALSGGMAFEGLNNAGQLKKDLIIVLNTNEMSISPSVGALSSYLNRIITNPLYNKVREELRSFAKRIPKLGPKVLESARRLEESLKNLVVPGIFFEELDIRYLGPIDGHNIDQLVDIFKKVTNIKGPKVIHVVTKKGKGYKPAEENPSIFHSAQPFEVKSGRMKDILDKSEKLEETISYTRVFSKALVNLAERRKTLVAITAAMPLGTGLADFASKFPDRFFDVGIAEGHAVCFASGLSKRGFIPIVAVYSTFLQRGYDQIFHDLCLQDLKVLLCIDRAGLVGEDGPTHHGLYDIAYLRHLPNLVIMAPKDADELISMINTAIEINHPSAIRYPKAEIRVPSDEDHLRLPVGEMETVKKGKDVCLLAYGSMVSEAHKAALLLEKDNINAEVINARFVKPLDEKIIDSIKKCNNKVVTVEEGCLFGGFGSAVSELIRSKRLKNIDLVIHGVPDKFIEHGDRQVLLDKLGLNSAGISELVKKEFFK
jgi:1-deoxy-D-xylulose-5-phosphate synthase